MNQDNLETLVKNLHIAQEKKNQNEEIFSLFKLGEYYFNEDNLIKSKLLFKQILNINSYIKEVNYNLGLIELKLENNDIAKKYFKSELNINSKHKFSKTLLEKLKISSNFPAVTILIFLINLIVFYFTYPQISLSYLIKFGVSNFNYSISNLITSLFFHANLTHFLVNSIILIMFGIILEKSIGSFKFLIVYLISGIFGNLFQVLFSIDGFVIGASSALFGIIGGLVMREPLMELRLFAIFKVPLILLFGSFFAIASIISSFFQTNIFIFGDIAHLIGFLFGMFLFGIMFKDSLFIFYNWLFIGTGFYIIVFSIKEYILVLNYNIYSIILFLFFLILGIFLIIFSYEKLKLMYKLKEENLKVGGKK